MSFPGPRPRRALPDGCVVVPPLGVRVDLVVGRVSVIGDLDRTNAHVFVDALSALASAGLDRWVVDVGELRACDRSGLRALSAGYRFALRQRARMTLVGATPALHQQLIRLRLAAHVVDPDDDLPTPSSGLAI